MQIRRLTKLALKSLLGTISAKTWQSPEEELNSFLEKICDDMARIPQKLADKTGLFAHFNSSGNQQPVFWCFNHWTEAVFLAYHLGPDRPLYAMHSLYRITKDEAKKSMHTLKLAEIYGDFLSSLYQDGPILLGGNCQAARITEAMGHYLLAKRGQSPILITLEYQPFYAYPGKLLMLFGDRSERFNPFLGKESPISNWHNKHQNAAWGFINGAHGEYFKEPGVHQLCWYIEQCTDYFSGDAHFPSGEIFQENHSNNLTTTIVDK